MIGDMGLGRRVLLINNGGTGAFAHTTLTPAAGRTYKATDNNSPLTQTRLYYSFGYLDNAQTFQAGTGLAPGAVGDVDVVLHEFGGEWARIRGDLRRARGEVERAREAYESQMGDFIGATGHLRLAQLDLGTDDREHPIVVPGFLEEVSCTPSHGFDGELDRAPGGHHYHR